MIRINRWLVAVILALPSLAFGGDAPDPVKALQGTWTLELPDGSEGHWIFEGDRVTAAMPGHNFVARIKVDADSHPAHLDFTILEGPGEPVDKTLLGLMEVGEQHARFAIARPEESRPQSFDPVEGKVLVCKLTRKLEASSSQTRDDLKALQGGWVCRLQDGDALWEFHDDRLTVTAPRRKYTTTIKLEPDAQPHPTIAFHIIDGPPDAKGKTNTGIYRLDGNVLTVCIDAGTGVAPAKFASENGKSYVFKMEKKPAERP